MDSAGAIEGSVSDASTALRVILFGTGSAMTFACLKALVEAGHEVLFVMAKVRLRSRFKRLLLRRWQPPERFARSNGVGVVWYDPARPNGNALAAFRPDILCIATFGHLIPPEVTALAPLGAINVHPSLLPRQRGPQPLFAIYLDGDAEGGLTVHRALPRFDAGPIILQEHLPIPRGYPVEQLETDLASRAGPLLLQAIALVRQGAPERPQDEAAATRGTRLDPAQFRAPLDQWDVAQSWHFLAAFRSRYRHRLTDADGREVRYRAVPGYTRCETALPPGSVERVADGWHLHCRGGVVHLQP